MSEETEKQEQQPETSNLDTITDEQEDPNIKERKKVHQAIARCFQGEFIQYTQGPTYPRSVINHLIKPFSR